MNFDDDDRVGNTHFALDMFNITIKTSPRPSSLSASAFNEFLISIEKLEKEL